MAGQLEQFNETLATYRKYGWQLARVLMRAETLEDLRAATGDVRLDSIAAREFPFDAMWFVRPSAGGREAWELRLVGDSPYALLELFEPDEAEEDREDVRREMEAKMKERLNAE
ncbi:MAG TPA: hypothetical protein VGW12_14335 [Pyrinomonadaceae bacterium]|nr:hypothetical protein [Pyrinomonadaceae bacterium]